MRIGTGTEEETVDQNFLQPSSAGSKQALRLALALALVLFPMPRASCLLPVYVCVRQLGGLHVSPLSPTYTPVVLEGTANSAPWRSGSAQGS